MCRYAKCTDEELIARLRSGEAEISDYLMEKYKGFVRKKARTMFLIGGEMPGDMIHEASQKSWIDRQLRWEFLEEGEQ